ncbi:MAG: hypothetical protein GXP06_00255 [Alphaproteobacteria bacterium]|nr:hypothetical protein [Alphaproteobacteria bacterium]
MTISPRKRERLAAFLGSLTTAAALKLFASLEAERAAVHLGASSGANSPGVNALPHGALISDLRDRLVQRGAIFPPRKPDARRMFFEPFEDFFIGAHTGVKRKAQIARSSLIPIWRLMMADQTTGDAAQAAAKLDDALLESADGVDVLERALFIAAEAGLGRLCARAEEDHAARDLLITALGSEEAYNDLIEIHQLLQGVEFLKQLQRMIPSAAPALTEEQYYDLRTLFLSAHNQSRGIGVYILLALKGRLEKPWRALGVYYHLAQGADDRLRAAKTEVTTLPESLFEDLEVLARGLENDCAKALDAETAGMRVSFFADYADGLARQSARAGDNVYLNRIEACKDVAGEALDRFAEQALAGLRAAMPVRHAGGSSRLTSLRPDLSRPVAATVVEDAADAAQLIAKAQDLAERLSADQSFTASIADDAAAQLHSFATDLVAEVRAAEGVERKIAQRTLDSVLMVAAPLLNSDEIVQIRDRAAAAFMTI